MAGHGNTSYLLVFNGAELAVEEINGLPQMMPANENYSMGLYGMGLCIRACRALYAYTTASNGGASSTPQNGITIPSTIGARMEAQTGTLAVRFMMKGCSTKPSTIAMMAYRIRTYSGCSQS